MYYQPMRRRIASLIFFLSAFLAAQDVRLAQVGGEILDMQGRPLAKADVVYTNAGNGRTYRCKTGSDGRFFMIGLILGKYDIKITGPTGRLVYSGTRQLYAGDQEKLNLIHFDASVIPTAASLAPFRGPKAAEIQAQKWRKAAAAGETLTPPQEAELREENMQIVRYNELTPEVQAALKQQDWKKAGELLRQLIAVAPFQWELRQNLGTMERNLGHYEEAAQAMAKGIELLRADDEAGRDPARRNAALAQMMIAEGEARAALDQPEKAAVSFREAIEIDVKPGIAYIHLCAAEYSSGHADEALEACGQAIDADRSRLDFYQMLAGIQMNLGRYKDAIRTYDKGMNVADSAIKMNRYGGSSNINSKSHAEISGAREQMARMGQMLISQGHAYFQLRDNVHAIEAFTRATQLHLYPALAYFNLCAAYYDMNEMAKASASCERATQADPGLADAWYVKATALYAEAVRRGKYKASPQVRQALTKYLELAPEGGYAEQARAMLKEIGGS